MAIESTTRKLLRIGDGSTTTFNVPFRFLDNSHLKVYLVDAATGTPTLQTITTHYTISGDGNEAEANVVFVSAPASTHWVSIYRETPLTQPESLFDNETQTATTVEQSIDRLTMILQELAEEVSRAQLAEITDPELPSDPSATSTVTDLFMAKITSAPTGDDHPFTEQQPVSGGSTNQNLSGGRTSTLKFANGCTDDKTSQVLFVAQMRDSDGATVYRGWLPGT